MPRTQPAAAVCLSPTEERKQASRARRYARYEAVRELHAHGFSGREIARRLKISRQKVLQFIHAEQFPERAPTRVPARASILDPYKPYILERWTQGCHNGTQLAHEIKAQGYSGSDVLVRLFVHSLRHSQGSQGCPTSSADPPSGSPAPPPKPLPKAQLSPTQASWLCVSQVHKLKKQEQEQVKQIQAAHPDFAVAYQLAQAFVVMLANRQASELDTWLLQAERSGIAELKSFAQGIRRDYPAVRSAFTSPWSNGQVEGQVGRLKLLKRQMYGRANFDLLRARVLHCA